MVKSKKPRKPKKPKGRKFKSEMMKSVGPSIRKQLGVTPTGTKKKKLTKKQKTFRHNLRQIL